MYLRSKSYGTRDLVLARRLFVRYGLFCGLVRSDLLIDYVGVGFSLVDRLLGGLLGGLLASLLTLTFWSLIYSLVNYNTSSTPHSPPDLLTPYNSLYLPLPSPIPAIEIETYSKQQLPT